MPSRIISLLLVVGGAFACHSPSRPPTVRPAGAIVLSLDDGHLYVADTDNDAVVVVTRRVLLTSKGLTASESDVVEKTITVGHSPERIVVDFEGRLFVSNRFGRSVSVVDPVAGKELTRIPVGTEPLGLALSPDGRTVAVANSTNGTVSLIDTKSLAVTRTIATPVNPTGVIFHPNGHLYLTHSRLGVVSVLDPVSGSPTHEPVSLVLPPAKTNGVARLPGFLGEPVIGPQGRLFVAMGQSQADLVVTNDDANASKGAYAGVAPHGPGLVAAVASGIATLDARDGDRLLMGVGLETLQGEFAPGSMPLDAVPPVIMTTWNQLPLSGASAAALEPNNVYLYVANMNSGNVAVLATDGAFPAGVEFPSLGGTTNGVLELIAVGAGPKGIVIPTSGDRAFVYSAFDETISTLSAVDGEVQLISSLSIGSPSATPAARGRRLFYGADDSRLSNPIEGGISCASCHPNGRDDGRVWLFTEGARKTPSLAGRQFSATSQLNWDGQQASWHDALKSVIEARMGGTGEGATNEMSGPLAQGDFEALLAFVNSAPVPDNPNLNADGTPVNADAVARGKTLFETTAGCAACHSGPTFTDNSLHDVGTHLGPSSGGQTNPPSQVKTPSLRGVFFAAPYFHDGAAPTLDAVVSSNFAGKHGATAGLSTSERADLVAYLKTL